MAAKLVLGGVYSLLVATKGKKRKTEDADPDDEGREFVGSYMSSRDANYYRGMGNGIGAAVAAMVRTAMAATSPVRSRSGGISITKTSSR